MDDASFEKFLEVMKAKIKEAIEQQMLNSGEGGSFLIKGLIVQENNNNPEDGKIESATNKDTFVSCGCPVCQVMEHYMGYGAGYELPDLEDLVNRDLDVSDLDRAIRTHETRLRSVEKKGREVHDDDA